LDQVNTSYYSGKNIQNISINQGKAKFNRERATSNFKKKMTKTMQMRTPQSL
jgi:hypothetical protein